MELLAPAGNLEKLYYAYAYGADAAYIGIKNFSLRAKADNFHGNEHQQIKKLKGGKKLYAALNIYFHDTDLKRFEENLEYIAAYPFDAFIISDIGLLPYIKKHFPGAPLHLSTQANCVNSAAAKLYQELGFSRIILGRELNLKEIEQIKARVNGLEIETFVHGAMCLAYSGRCFLSKQMANRSANRGDCAHSCRWKFRVLEEEQRPGHYFPVIQGDNFTTILSSKDMCMIDHLDKLKSAGIDAVKIEGRMKSVYYTAITTRAYRKALDALNGQTDPRLQEYTDELSKVSHREFSTGFYFGKEDMEIPTEKSYIRQYAFLGSIGERLGRNRYQLLVKNQICSGDQLEFLGPDILSVQDNNFKLLTEGLTPVDKADHGKAYVLETSAPLQPGYLIRKKL